MGDTKIIFVGNYKGGVGKTTSVLNFAEYFALEDNREKTDKNKVLVLDVDPQSSLSEILVKNAGNGEERSLSDLDEKETLNYVFDLSITKIEKYSNMQLNFDRTLLIKKYKSSFDFIPSSLFYKNETFSAEYSVHILSHMHIAQITWPVFMHNKQRPLVT